MAFEVLTTTNLFRAAISKDIIDDRQFTKWMNNKMTLKEAEKNQLNYVLDLAMCVKY